MEHGEPHPLGEGRGRVLVTGARGQLGTALLESFPGAAALGAADWDVTEPAPPAAGRPALVRHAAAWTDVDGAESDPQGAFAVNAAGTRNVVALGVPVVYYSTDYVFDGAKCEPYVESDATGPRSVYGRSKLAGEAEVADGWIVRSSWLFGWTAAESWSVR